jgi:hypothetical protein
LSDLVDETALAWSRKITRHPQCLDEFPSTTLGGSPMIAAFVKLALLHLDPLSSVQMLVAALGDANGMENVVSVPICSHSCSRVLRPITGG